MLSSFFVIVLAFLSGPQAELGTRSNRRDNLLHEHNIFTRQIKFHFDSTHVSYFSLNIYTAVSMLVPILKYIYTLVLVASHFSVEGGLVRWAEFNKCKTNVMDPI